MEKQQFQRKTFERETPLRRMYCNKNSENGSNDSLFRFHCPIDIDRNASVDSIFSQ